MNITKPIPGEYAPYYHTYVSKVVFDDLITALEQGGREFLEFVRNIPADKLDFRYAEGKWTVKEVIGHLIDAERVFAYRAMRFARNDKTALPGFEENNYVPESNANYRSIESLIEEVKFLRKATVAMFQSFNSEMMLRKGPANGKDISVRALGFIIAGHELHHMGVIMDRYLTPVNSFPVERN